MAAIRDLLTFYRLLAFGARLAAICAHITQQLPGAPRTVSACSR
jgi:hypothetical protein